MNALIIAWNDLQRMFHERQIFFWVFVSPLIFVTFFGVVFGPQTPAPRTLDIVNEDESDEVAAGLAATLTADGVRVRRVERAGSVRPRLVVPAGTRKALRASANVELRLDVGPEETNGERNLRFAVQKALMALVLGDVSSPASPRSADARGPGPIVVVSRASADGPRPMTSGFQRSVPAYLVMFVFMNLLISGAGLSEDRASGRLRRLLIAPVPRRDIVLGKLVGRFALGWIQILWMLGLGVFVFRIHWADHALVFVGFLTLFALACAALGLLLGTLFDDPDTCVNVAVWSVIVLSPLGGLWWPLEIVGPTMRQVAAFTPTGWAMEAVNTMLAFGGGARDVAPYAAAFAGVAVVSVALAARRLRAGN